MNVRKTFSAFAGLVLSIAAAGPAFAAPVSYILAGNFSGTLSGQAVSIDGTFLGLGDSDTAVTGSTFTTVNLSSLTLTSATTTYNFNGNFDFFSNINGISGFTVRGGQDVLTFSAPALTSYDPRFDAVSTPVAFAQGKRLYTDNSDLLVTEGTGLIFGQDTAGSPSAIPEPATWLMMVAGFGLVGAGLRRRARQTVVAA